MNYPADDRYFRFHFANTQRMAGLLREFLPPEICAVLDFATLRRLHEQHLGEELRELRDDLNLECRTGSGQKVLVRLLVEHKSLHDPGLWLQMLKSMVAYWNHTGFIAVIPVVVHTGPQPFRLETPKNWLRTPSAPSTLRNATSNAFTAASTWMPLPKLPWAS